MLRRQFLKRIASVGVRRHRQGSAAAPKPKIIRGPSPLDAKLFRQVWYVQQLRRFQEELALTYAVPYRYIDDKGEVHAAPDSFCSVWWAACWPGGVHQRPSRRSARSN